MRRHDEGRGGRRPRPAARCKSAAQGACTKAETYVTTQRRCCALRGASEARFQGDARARRREAERAQERGRTHGPGRSGRDGVLERANDDVGDEGRSRGTVGDGWSTCAHRISCCASPATSPLTAHTGLAVYFREKKDLLAELTTSLNDRIDRLGLNVRTLVRRYGPWWVAHDC